MHDLVEYYQAAIISRDAMIFVILYKIIILYEHINL